MLIVGLGNPGEKYDKTRHNVGFMVLDKLINELNATKTSSSFKGELFKTNDILLLKPTTYMNLSGESVVLVKNFYKIDLKDIIVIHDDLDLPFGSIKFKKGGSNGGHNGLKSIDYYLGSDYIRVRVGIGKPAKKHEVVDYVLGRFSEDEKIHLDKIISHTTDAILQYIKTKDLDFIKSKYSIKNPKF